VDLIPGSQLARAARCANLAGEAVRGDDLSPGPGPRSARAWGRGPGRLPAVARLPRRLGGLTACREGARAPRVARGLSTGSRDLLKTIGRGSAERLNPGLAPPRVLRSAGSRRRPTLWAPRITTGLRPAARATRVLAACVHDTIKVKEAYLAPAPGHACTPRGSIAARGLPQRSRPSCYSRGPRPRGAAPAGRAPGARPRGTRTTAKVERVNRPPSHAAPRRGCA